MAGISSRQGSHHVAQKLRNMVFPLKSFREIFFPSGSVRVKSGVGVASFMGCRIGIALKLTLDWADAGVAPSVKNIRNKPQNARVMKKTLPNRSTLRNTQRTFECQLKYRSVPRRQRNHRS